MDTKNSAGGGQDVRRYVKQEAQATDRNLKNDSEKTQLFA